MSPNCNTTNWQKMPVNKQTEQNYKPHSKRKIPQTKIRQNLPFSLPELSLQHVRETESEQ